MVPLLNSQERREARYQRRKAKRKANRLKRIETCTLDEVASFGNLVKAAKQAARGVRWKYTVQAYMADLFQKSLKARRDLLQGEDIRRGFVEFNTYERGKLRHITSVHFSERVVQKSISQNALTKAIWPTMTAGCSANIKGRGLEYAVRRMKQHLVRHYQKHGSEGYILLVDFSNYFANIDHDACKDMIDRALDDEPLKELIFEQIDSQTTARGLGLGSEPNQVLAVALPAPLDHLAERFPGVETCDRYMDDSAFIALEKETLWSLLDALRVEADKLGIVINEKKTRIVKLSRGFTFLKKRFSYGANGKVVVRPCRTSIIRHRRKLKKLKRFVDSGLVTRDQVYQSHQSWRGQMKHLDAHAVVLRMDALYSELYGKEDNHGNTSRD